MLELSYKSMLTRILAAENLHINDPSEAAMLSRDWEFVFSDFDGWVILGISTNKYCGYWVYPRLCPESKIEALKHSLPHFSFIQPSAAYGEVMSGDRHWIEPYWGDKGNFNDSEVDVYFSRLYYGRQKGEEKYVELNQLVTHSLGLHWSPLKNSFCIMNDLGEEVEKIKLIRSEGIRLVLMRRRTLDKLLYLGKWVLVRYTIFSRRRAGEAEFKTLKKAMLIPSGFEAKFEVRQFSGRKLEYIEFRGAEIQRPITPRNEVLSREPSEDEEAQKYAEFIVEDWKNNRILKNYSIQPSNFADYFTNSELPFELSPIFFNAEVLDKYKNNPDKYNLDERSISCRGGWHLETYDVNEYNQVHTYAVYLNRLPYKEQLYWLQYNEEPKGHISKRAVRTDFEAEWPEEASPLEKLRASLEELSTIIVNGQHVWIPKGGTWETASKGLNYVHTENPNQWHDFIIALANTTNGGFQIKALKPIAAKLGVADERLGTLGLIKNILIKTGNDEHLPNTHAILNDLQEKRGQGKAHGAWITPEGSLVEDAKVKLKNVTASISKLADIFSRLKMSENQV